MTATVEATNGLPSSAGFRLGRRGAVLAAIVAAVLGCALVTTAALYLDGRYGPIEAGQFGGMYSTQGLALSPDGSSDRLAASTDASAQLLESLSNTGSHPVEVTEIDTDDVVTHVRWSELRTVPGGYVSGISTPWREFPAEIPAHTTIRLLITIHRPAYCRVAANGNDLYSGTHRVHWKSLLRRHITTVGDQVAKIHVC
jgi:hypothetical protein